jgi:hypothetical protein
LLEDHVVGEQTGQRQFGPGAGGKRHRTERDDEGTTEKRKVRFHDNIGNTGMSEGIFREKKRDAKAMARGA